MGAVGRAVECRVCHMHKKPIGRSASPIMANGLCDDDCPGYREDPFPGSLWPGETEEDFGFACSGPAEHWPGRRTE